MKLIVSGNISGASFTIKEFYITVPKKFLSQTFAAVTDIMSDDSTVNYVYSNNYQYDKSPFYYDIIEVISNYKISYVPVPVLEKIFNFSLSFDYEIRHNPVERFFIFKNEFSSWESLPLFSNVISKKKIIRNKQQNL